MEGRDDTGEGEGRTEGTLGTPGCSVGGVAIVEVSSVSVVAGVAVVVVGVVNELVVRAGRKIQRQPCQHANPEVRLLGNGEGYKASLRFLSLSH